MLTLSPRMNSLIARLLQDERSINLDHELTIILLSCGVTSVLLFFLFPLLAEILSPRASSGTVLISGILIGVVPSILGCAASVITFGDIHSEAYDLLKISYVSSKELLWSYVLATLYRVRIFLRIAIGITPILAFGIGYSAWIESELRRPNNGPVECATSPLGMQYCRPEFDDEGGIYTENGSLDFDNLVAQFQLAVAGFGTAVSLLGISVLATVSGGASVYLWNSRSVALSVTLVFTFVLGFLVIKIVIPELVICAIMNVKILHVIPMLAYSAVYCVIPFALSAFGMNSLQRRTLRFK